MESQEFDRTQIVRLVLSLIASLGLNQDILLALNRRRNGK